MVADDLKSVISRRSGSVDLAFLIEGWLRHANYFLLASLWASQRGITKGDSGSGSQSRSPLAVGFVYVGLVMLQQTLGMLQRERKVVSRTKCVYLIGMVIRRKFFSHLSQDETKIMLFKSMELLYNYTNSTKNRAESQLLGFCSLLIGEKNLENE